MVMLNLIVLFTLQGACVGSVVELTCGGCKSEENSPEYYCSGVPRYLYFRCEGSGSSSLIWTVSSQDQEEQVILGSESPEENTIRRGNITVYVDTVDSTDSHSIIILSHLWLNLGDLDSDVTVSCSNNGKRNMKALKQLDSVQPPNSGGAAVYMNPTKNERVVHYEWSHESPDTVLHYNTKTSINGTLISTVTLPSGSVNGSSVVSEGKLHLEIEAVGLCGHTATHAIDAIQYFHITEEPPATTTTDQGDCQNEKSHSPSIAGAVVTTAVVTGVVCFTAGLLLFFLYPRCRQVRNRGQAKNNDTEGQPLPFDDEKNKGEIYLANRGDKSSNIDDDSGTNKYVDIMTNANKNLTSADDINLSQTPVMGHTQNNLPKSEE